MSNHQALNPADHANLRVHTGAGAQYGDAVMASLVVPGEFRRLCTVYPILFRHDAASGQFSALALFGFEAGENLFLAGETWDAPMRPLAMAVQPFLVGRSRDGEGPSQIHIDRDHPRVSAGEDGTRLFDDTGVATPLVDDMAAMLGALDEGYRASGDFYAAANRYDLLEPFALDVGEVGGEQHRLVGYHLVNEERLAALEPAPLAELHAGGHLEPLFMALASLGNLSKLARMRAARARG
ncbi:SapC family protein [Parablastomonas sp. CN1-191]|uniref:SapC family protein n=1 Tax=Parablastomonas sp. CN1-191 TaxID=3400908 RepID=UPI003BF8C506